MTLVPNETEQALNRQHDVYAAAREEYRKKIAEQAAEIERLRAALEEAAKVAENASFQFTQTTPSTVEVVDVRHTIAAAIRALVKEPQG